MLAFLRLYKIFILWSILFPFDFNQITIIFIILIKLFFILLIVNLVIILLFFEVFIPVFNSRCFMVEDLLHTVLGLRPSLFTISFLTLFFPMFPFDPPENIRKPKVFRCFQGDQKGTLGRKGLISSVISMLIYYKSYWVSLEIFELIS